MLLFAWGLSFSAYLVACVAEQLLPMALWIAGDDGEKADDWE